MSQRDQQGAPREERGQPRPFEPFPVLSSERIYDSPWCGLRRDWLDLGDSGDEPQEYHVFEIGDAVSVLPLLEDGSILLIGQYRHPTGQTRCKSALVVVAVGLSIHGIVASIQTPSAIIVAIVR